MDQSFGGHISLIYRCVLILGLDLKKFERADVYVDGV